MYDLCLHSGSTSTSGLFFVEVKKTLEKRGIKTLLYTDNKRCSDVWDLNGVTDYILLPAYSGKTDVKEAARFAESLGIKNFRTLYQTIQIFHDKSEEECQKAISEKILALKSCDDSKKARIYLTFAGDEYGHNIFRLLARKHGGKIAYTASANIPGRISFSFNDERFWELSEIPKTPVPEEEKKWLQNFIESYQSKKTILWANPKDRDVKIKMFYFEKAFKRLIRFFSGTSDKTRPPFFWLLKRFLIRFYRRNAANLVYDKNPEQIIKSPYIYFPLHYPKDAQLTLRGKPFINQTSVVEIISCFVPYPLQLVVKEHPLARGFFPIKELKKIKKLPNVKLLHPLFNSHNLIPDANAIIAINSSVGYEGIMYKKPVITLGKSFYRGLGYTIDIGWLYELEEAFQKINSFNLTDDDVIEFLWRIKSNSYELPYRDVFKGDLSVAGKTGNVIAEWFFKHCSK